MRGFALSLFLTLAASACDLQPAPKETGSGGGMTDPSTQPAGSAAAPSAPPQEGRGTPDAPPPPTNAVDPAVKPVPGLPTADPVVSSPECVAVADKIAGIMIASSTDPQQKASLEQERAKNVNRMAQGCTKDKWPDAALKCFATATTLDAITACSVNLPAPQ